jgi:hypothetical protein
MAYSDIHVFEIDAKSGVINPNNSLEQQGALGLWNKLMKWNPKVDLINLRYKEMRLTLFKWMRDIVDRKILGERNMDVLFLACEIFDKFVSIKKSLMSKGTLETFEEYGITCLMLAIKGCMDCDCHGFTLEHAAKLANSFPNTIRKYEIEVLKTLDYDIDLPTIADILERTDFGAAQNSIFGIEETAFERMVLEGYTFFINPMTLAQLATNH